jgi:integrase/recombinase XerD
VARGWTVTSAELAAHLSNYLALRRATGFAMRVEERLLLDFMAFLEQAERRAPGAQSAVDWATSASATCGPGGRSRRLTVVRGFLLYLSSFDPQIHVPERGLLRGTIRAKPHIFSGFEIQSLLRAARSLGPQGSLRPHTYEALIGLLLSTGLRAGEAIRLRDQDVVLQAEAPAHLQVLRTKFRKSRLVPLHPSTAEALHHYRRQRARLGKDAGADAFFISQRGTALRYRTASGVFVELAREVGLRGPAGTRGPSLHSLRHTFAVHRLVAWYREGRDVYGCLPNLAVYLGHLRLAETYWYLTATPDLLCTAAARFAAYAQHAEAS